VTLPVLLLIASASTQAPPPQAAPSARTITYDATEYSFHGPTQTSAGLVTIRLVNRGKEMHWMETYRLGAGKTLDDFLRAITPGHPWPDGVATPTGGPSWVLPGQVSNQTSYLQPGLYVLMCRVEGPDSVAHLKKGMVSVLTVSATSARTAAEQRADVTVVITDSSFVMPDSMSRGLHTFLVQNRGSVRHEIAVSRLAPGKSFEDLAAWERGGMKKPDPFTPAGGVTPFAAGAKVWFTGVFNPGKYVFSDELGEKGIVRQIVVR
jgi:hypothetical protein